MIKAEHKSKTLGGLKWNIINQLIQHFISLVISVVLARLLTPEDFGVIGLITVLTGFLQIFRDFGLGSALIHKGEISHLEISTVFWTNLGMGVLLSLFLVGASDLICTFYNNESLKPFILVLSLNFVIQALNYIQSTLLRKDLGFRKLFGVNFLASLVSGILALWMAYTGYGTWSIVAQTLVSNVINTVILWSISKWRPSFEFSWLRLKGLMGFSLPLLGTQTLHYWNRNADNLLVGKFLGESALGTYTKAYSLMLFPVRQISGMLSVVMFPSIALIQNDLPRVAGLYVKSVRILSLITIPLMGLLFVIADQFVHTILGARWHEAIPVIRILCGVGAMQSISTLNGNIFQGLGKTALQLKLNLYLGIFIVSSIAVGVTFGLKGVAYGYLFSTLLSGFVLRYYIGRLLNVKVIDLLKPVIPSLFLSTIVVITLTFFKNVFAVSSTSFVDLFFVSAIYAALIVALFFLFIRKELEFSISMFKQLLKSK